VSNSNDINIQRSTTLNRINGIGRTLKAIGLDPFKLNAEKIIRKAKRKAGYKGELSPELTEGVHRLVESVKSDANPNPFGALAARILYQKTLTGRLQVEQVLAQNPAIEKTEIKEPIFIIGMPRTGTTILHAMMHEDPNHRSPLSWECLLPYPVSTPDTFEDNPQLKQIRKEFEQLFKLVPDFKKKHHMEADSPQECIGINALDFNSFQPSATLYIPSYMEWFDHSADRLKTMRFHKRFLQYLQSGGVMGKRWLLKSPVHLMRLPEIFEVYPDAKIIMTHRSPEKVVPSAASLITSVRSLYSDTEDPIRTGKEQENTWSMYFERFLEDRKRLNKEDQIIDLKFEDFVQDQVGTIERVYEHFGWELEKDTIQKFQRFLDANPKDKHGAHIYSLETFGLTETGIREKFHQYHDFLSTLK